MKRIYLLLIACTISTLAIQAQAPIPGYTDPVQEPDTVATDSYGYVAEALSGTLSDPVFTNPWQVAASLGLGYLSHMGDLANNFGDPIIFSAALEGRWKRINLAVQADFGQPSFARDNLFNLIDEHNNPTEVNSPAAASLSHIAGLVGYTVYETPKMRVTPLVGVIHSRYSWSTDLLEWTKDEAGQWKSKITDNRSRVLSHTGWTATCNVDIRLRSPKPSNILRQGEMLTSWIRISPFIAQVNQATTVPAAKGYVAGIRLSYTGALTFY